MTLRDHTGGGQAFPTFHIGEVSGTPITTPGMSLRDYFAGQALCGPLSNIRPAAAAAAIAYEIADAMLAARSTLKAEGGEK
jgi:hypothetical protein